MRILLLRTEEPKVHILEQRHMDQIRALDKSIELYAPLAASTEEVQTHLADAEALAGFPRDLAEISLAFAPRLKWIHSFSAGMEKVLTPELKASDVIVSNSSGVHAIPIAEYVLACIFIFAKKFYQSFQNQQEKRWQALDGMTEIRDATVLVVGLGRIGTEIAKVTAGSGMYVIAIDRSAKGKPEFVQELYSTEQMEQVLPKADYVVLSLPATVETHHLFDMEKFRIMKKSAVLINIGRGELIHEQELIEALRQNVIAGAALDVMEIEPLPHDSPLWKMENVVITPHHSSHTKKRMDRTVDLFCENIQAYLRGEQLSNFVDKQKGY